MLIETAKAKELVLAHRAAGMPVAQAMAAVGRQYETWKDWRRNDDDFKAKSDAIRGRLQRGDVAEDAVPDFPEFSGRYLFTKLPLHHLRIWDAINDREPREMHEAMTYRPGSEGADQIVINVPPDHAKSTTWTMNYVSWRIHKDPTIRVIVISKTQKLAKQFLLGIKQRLTHPKYQEMHAAFAPKGGWRSEDKGDGLAWREDLIYVRGRDPEEKDPTIQAVGIGGQVYGARADLIVLDDCEDLGNYGSYEAHAGWIAQEVMSRLSPEELPDGTFIPGGQLIVLGTRVGPIDLYRHLRDAVGIDEEPTWTYFAQPAILEGESDPNHENWLVLWPERMTPRVLRKKRNNYTDQRRFQLIYQQADVSDESAFPAVCVKASVNGQRYHGRMVSGAVGHRLGGMDGLYVIGSWDPASSAGNNAMIALGVDRRTQKRWVLDVWNKKGALPRDSDAKLREWTLKYGIREWIIEKNAVQEYIVQLDSLRNFLAANGCKLVPHHTHKNKLDADVGVETLAPLFESCASKVDNRWIAKPKGSGLIELPNTERNPHVQTLVNQLILWEPGNKRLTQDLVMALWFSELSARKWLRRGSGGIFSHFRSPFVSRAEKAEQITVSMEELYEQGLVREL